MRYNTYKRRNPSAPTLASKKNVEVKEVPGLDVFIAASAAYRINGNKLIKDVTCDRDEDGNVVKEYQPNKFLIRNMITSDDHAAMITDQDREDGQAVQSYWRMKMFAILSGNTNEYIANSVKYASMETIKINDYFIIACIASLPLGMEKGIVRDIRDEARQDAQMLSEHFGTVGEKVSGRVKVTSCFYSQKWQCYYMNGVVGTNVIMWANANKVEVDKEFNFTGKIKAHRENNVTQLNFVRLKYY